MNLIPFATRRHGVAVAAGLLAATLALSVHAADPSEFSRAEKLVFVDHHLSNIKTPTTLRYSFVKSGTLEPGYTDEVKVDVDTTVKTCCLVKGSFLTGERRESTPEIPEAESNPAVLYFLEHDIREMQRLTKGKSNYFRKRIRMAMVDEAQVRDVKISYKGRELAAQEVTLSPYAKDPARSRYDRYADKRYTFVIAKDVPGGVYQVRTVMGGPQVSDPVMIEEVMTLVGADPAPVASAPSNAR